MTRAKKTEHNIISDVTGKLFEVILTFLNAGHIKPDVDGVVRIESSQDDMRIALNAVGNVAAGLLCACPDAHDKIEWFCLNVNDSCQETMNRRDEEARKMTLQ
jgi:hypothetical protein